MIKVIQKAEQEGNNTPVKVSVVDGSLDVNNLFKDGSTDAFGRQRVSEQFTLGDYSHIYGVQHPEMLFKKSIGIGNINFDRNQAKAQLFVGSSIGEFAIYQSRKYHYYRPGKSQLVYTSFNFNAPYSFNVKRIGYFDDYNGIYFQNSGLANQIVLRSNVSGNIQEQVISQSNWNKDTCNGSGISKFNLDITKTQLFTTDFQWLGVGRVRAGFVHNGETVIAHEFYNSNNKNTVYWSNPSLPVRAEILNVSAGPGFPIYLDFICATVVSEGGDPEAGIDFDIRTTGSRIITANNSLPMIAIRMKTGFNNSPNRIYSTLGKLSIISEDNNIAWEVWRLTGSNNILGGSWVNVNDQSATEYNTSATGFNTSNGYRFDAGFALAGGQGAGQYQGGDTVEKPSTSRQSYIAQNIDATDSNIFVLTATNLTNTDTNCFASMQWREIR